VEQSKKTELKLFIDGTTRYHSAIENVIIGLMADNGFKCVTLASSTIPETESAECSTVAFVNTFKDGRDLLADWHHITERMFPKHQAILAMIPNPSQSNSELYNFMSQDPS
jgi:hypothetical protein